MTSRTDTTPRTTTAASPARRRLLLGAAGALAGLGLSGCFQGGGIELAGATVNDLSGQPVKLASLEGSPTVITFWATTCPSCVEEIPHIQELHDTYAAKGVDVVGLAMSYDPVDQIRRMTTERNMTYTIWHDSRGEGSEAFGGVRVTPSFFVLDGEGRIEYQKLGPVDMNRVRNILDRLTA